MDESKFRAFLSVARNKNFARAAQEMYVVPSTISRQISALEEELGTQLFYRDTHRVELTPAGQRIYDNNHAYLTQFQNINDSIHNLLVQSEHRLHVVSGPYEGPLVDMAGRLFQEADPEMELHLVISPYLRQQQYVRAGSTRLFFGTRACADMLPDCEYTSLGTYQWKATARRDSSLWPLPPEQQAVLQDQQLICAPDQDLHPAQSFLEGRPLKYRSRSVAGSFSMACVQAGLGGVALLPEYMESWLPRHLRMEQIFPDPPMIESVLIFNPKDSTPQEQRFFRYIRDNFKP